jgi:hypothetical protein
MPHRINNANSRFTPTHSRHINPLFCFKTRAILPLLSHAKMIADRDIPMTAHASPMRLIGPALPEHTLRMSETDGQRVLVLGTLAASRPDLVTICRVLEIDPIPIGSHHDLPFRLHHCRPLAVLSDLPLESHALSAALRCIGAYDPDLPVLMLADDADAALGTIDAAQQLWGLSNMRREAPRASPHALIQFLFHAGRVRGMMRLLPVA